MKRYLYAACFTCFFIIAHSRPVSAQTADHLKKADSLFAKQDYKNAREHYLAYLGDTSKNSLAWNRLGYCNQTLGLYADAVTNYNRALANNPNPPVRNVVLSRMARTYSLLNKPEESADYLLKSTAAGYNALPDLDSAADFKNLRSSPKFKTIRREVYETIYPCTKEPRAHDFDFWTGDWDVFATGTRFLVGHSHIEPISGGCAILENWQSTQAQSGKSFNFYDDQVGKWEQDWIGSGGFAAGRQRYINGEYKDGAMRFAFEAKDAKGAVQPGHFIFYNIDSNTVRQYQELSSDGGKTFTAQYDLTYVRKK